MTELGIEPTDLDWLVRLARGLVDDPLAAEDVVQDALVLGLERGVPERAPARAWLAGATRRLALRERRGSHRRRNRERVAAKAEAVADSSGLVERAELAEALLGALRGLDEPYRQTMLLRYLEDRSPREIALVDGVPIDTVRWRLRRAHELVRETLVRQGGRDWDAWSVALFPLARLGGRAGSTATGALGGTSVFAATGVLVKTAVAPLALASLAIITAWSVLQSRSDEPARAPAGEAARAAIDLPGTSSPDDRARALAAPTSGPAPDDPRRVVDGAGPRPEEPALRGRIVDPLGVPVPGAVAYLVSPPDPGSAAGGAAAEPLLKVSADASGEFAFDALRVEQLRGAGALDLGALAAGFRRTVLEGATADWPGDVLVVTLDRGESLSGRVVDSAGRGVPGLRLLAYGEGASVSHVSPTQVAYRAERALFGGRSATYQHCEAVTDSTGRVEFGGLGSGRIRVRSLDPGWSLESPAQALAGETGVVWPALRRLGVELFAVGLDDQPPAERVRAVFRVELEYEDGERVDYGQWIGRGQGLVSFGLDEDSLPPEAWERRIVGARFYGTAGAGQAEAEWSAPWIRDRDGASGVARARVELELLAEPASGAEDSEEQVDRMAEIDLDVRYSDASPVLGRIAVRWRSVAEDGRRARGVATPEPSVPGRYRIEVAAGTVELEVHPYGWSGSLDEWQGATRVEPGERALVMVELDRGGEVVIERPLGFRGDWFVRASWRENESDPWFGSMGYGSAGETLELFALQPAQWRFELRNEESDAEPLVRIERVERGERVVVR